MRTVKFMLFVALVVAAVFFWRDRTATTDPAPGHADIAATARKVHLDSLPAFLPPQAHQTLALIARGGPFPHHQDGGVFQNREGLLPEQPRGYYHEYTVETPGLDYRGARRIISGGNPPVIFYYSADHYRHFRSFKVNL